MSLTRENELANDLRDEADRIQAEALEGEADGLIRLLREAAAALSGVPQGDAAMTFEEWWDSLGSEWYGKHAPAGKGIAQTAWQASRKEALRHAAEVCREEYADRCCHPLLEQAAECCAQAIERKAEGFPSPQQKT